MISGVGIDIVKVSRVNEKLIDKILSKQEKTLYISREDKPQFLAGRWAVKEAIIKATEKEIAMNNINIYYINKKPTWEGMENNSKISISHEKEYAIGMCIIEK